MALALVAVSILKRCDGDMLVRNLDAVDQLLLVHVKHTWRWRLTLAESSFDDGHVDGDSSLL